MSSEAQEEKKRGASGEAPLPGRDESRHQLEAVASAAVTAAEPSTPAATGARLLRLRFIDGELPAIHVGAVQRRDGCLGFFRRGHFHEAEAA